MHKLSRYWQETNEEISTSERENTQISAVVEELACVYSSPTPKKQNDSIINEHF